MNAFIWPRQSADCPALMDTVSPTPHYISLHNKHGCQSQTKWNQFILHGERVLNEINVLCGERRRRIIPTKGAERNWDEAAGWLVVRLVVQSCGEGRSERAWLMHHDCVEPGGQINSSPFWIIMIVKHDMCKWIFWALGKAILPSRAWRIEPPAGCLKLRLSLSGPHCVCACTEKVSLQHCLFSHSSFSEQRAALWIISYPGALVAVQCQDPLLSFYFVYQHQW